jgi:hypothetical protein
MPFAAHTRTAVFDGMYGMYGTYGTYTVARRRGTLLVRHVAGWSASCCAPLPSAADFTACVGDTGYYAKNQNRCNRQIALRHVSIHAPDAKKMALASKMALGRRLDADRTNGHKTMVAQHFGPEALGLEHGEMAL